MCVHLQSLPTVNGFLDAAIAALPGWRKILPNYPVVSWLSFVEYIRATVNSLASDGHIRELVCHLQLVGEVWSDTLCRVNFITSVIWNSSDFCFGFCEFISSLFFVVCVHSISLVRFNIISSF